MGKMQGQEHKTLSTPEEGLSTQTRLTLCPLHAVNCINPPPARISTPGQPKANLPSDHLNTVFVAPYSSRVRALGSSQTSCVHILPTTYQLGDLRLPFNLCEAQVPFSKRGYYNHFHRGAERMASE